MQVKRFFAADMRQAMKLVRDELGPDAAIIGNRRVAGGVELTAALDYQAPVAASKPNPALEAELRKTQAKIAQAKADLSAPARASDGVRKDRQMYGTEKPRRSAAETLAAAMDAPAAPAPAAVGQQALEAMRFELNGLRELIEVQLGSIAWNQLQNQRPKQAGLWRRLQRMGLPADLSRNLLERVASIADPKQAWRMLLAHLARSINTPEIDLLEQGGVIALVGPAGMGKTTTLAKLAARYVLKYGAQSIALVSMDSFRIGAQEQIKTLGRILNVPVTLVDPGQSLIQAMAPLARKRLVLIDTAGLPANDPALRMQLEALSSLSLNVKNYLVLAATSQSQVLKSAWQNYRSCGLAGCILTKLDEAGSLGEALALAISQHLPVAYLADGPKIPDDLHVARAHQLVSRAVSLQSPEEPCEDAMADMFAGLYQQPVRRAS
ncbi:flagellar biosynthesis protein FlhF [Pseudomonas nicosulfuronedens]|uniref:Flagellar biosynthesis protein FlhF n=1 Tax=Pseudomonas nicosulfuronedens TaxID=2571105 RepID=A0A5R9RRU8_9PSED|nr:flagellar biosynthesis protein FlhF [Pseudomonas nicosulfuronedens]MDH1010579.1 flagellar biosynthesis protein FlhF [Pseudomonas nicosulfuronedens]MDH1979673.1 flagellar biosynthesis protein FlhF [Pseudomonas nicosulfuronedens]MDH2028108.1 flagellar biosynthesis protein FlhF [Pseudomonas nicosulfuronedens]TLX80271.1 flagellar biosynthesis protein FlhF [Pseudomonas nicosulfuronedens]